MVRFYRNTSTFDFTWEQVAQAFWMRYPNPESTHVLSEDTIFREIRDGKLYTKKLLTKTNKVPKWCERFVTNRVVKILEESIVDPKNQIMVTHTRNLGYTSVMGVVERVTYKASDEDPNKTVAIRRASFDSHVYGFAKALQSLGVERFKKNCVKTVRGFNFVLHKMFPNAQNTLQIEDAKNHTTISQSSKDKFKDAAKKATDLAKSKTATMFVNIDS